MSKVSRKERTSRLLGIVTLGAITTLAVTYVIAPRFNEPTTALVAAFDEVDKKIMVNERVALLQGQEESLDKILEDLEQTSIALPEPSASADSDLKAEIEDLLRQIGLSSNSLTAFDTPQQSSSWTAVTNPYMVYDEAKAVAAAGNGEAGMASMFQKPLFVQIQGPVDRLVQFVRRVQMLDRLVVVDSFAIAENEQQFGSPTLDIDARIFLMPGVESPLVASGTDDGTIDEVETLPNAPGAGNN